MKLTFYIDYRTNWGESVYLVGDPEVLGAGNYDRAVRMRLIGESTWQAEVEISDKEKDFAYRYFVRHENGYIKNEWGDGHNFHRVNRVKNYEIFDRWTDQPYDKPFYSTVFTECVNKRDGLPKPTEAKAGDIVISVEAPTLRPDEVLAISGQCHELGDWDTKKALIMNDAEFPVWSAAIEFKNLPRLVEYKFVVLKKATRELVAWEGRDNRVLNVNPTQKNEIMLVNGLRFVNSLGQWHGAGVAIPVFSLRSEDDFGVGDFIDLKKMVDWAVATHQNFIQILPINDTTMTHTWTDSYPYNANSTFALHPMYLRLEMLGTLDDASRREHYANLRRELNRLPEIDYERVNEAKTAYTREIFAQNGDATLKSADFNKFVEKNASWLTPYAAFCVLRDLNNTPEFQNWGEYAHYDKAKIDEFIKEHTNDINFVYYQQYHLDRQMREVRAYAHAHGIAIKGDIPIGISRTSVDAWISPRLFNLNSQAGAPPDDFSVLGQNWGFPTYNWEEMSLDGFAWWKDRFRKMAEYFDAYRIDHVLGFFRIWQIPMDAIHGLLGVFNPALPFTPDELRNNYDFWIDVDLQTTPFIMDYFIGDFFGEYTDEVKQRFLNDAGYGRWKLKTEFNTQRKIAEYFANLEKDDKNNRICNGLLGLIDQVLFIEDPVEKGKYHPRISAQYTYIYNSLNEYERWCFNRLYNDFFYHRHNDFWYGKAMWKLPPLIDATHMLTCAEDLGMIPDCVAAVMNALQILTLDIQRMPKDPKTEFGNTWSYPYYSVCTTSTHDMTGIRAWWEEDREVTQRFYNNVLHEHGAAPYFAEPWVCERIIQLHLKSPSMLCILPLQDWLSIDGELRRDNPQAERINVPANSRHYWRYRMHLTLEDLNRQDLLNRRLFDLIRDSGR